MNKELIKSELISEIESLIKINNQKYNDNNPLTNLSNKIGGLKDCSALVNSKMNEILNKHGVKFNSPSEKQDFVKFITPIVKDLVGKCIRN